MLIYLKVRGYYKRTRQQNAGVLLERISKGQQTSAI